MKSEVCHVSILTGLRRCGEHVSETCVHTHTHTHTHTHIHTEYRSQYNWYTHTHTEQHDEYTQCVVTLSSLSCFLPCHWLKGPPHHQYKLHHHHYAICQERGASDDVRGSLSSATVMVSLDWTFKSFRYPLASYLVHHSTHTPVVIKWWLL